LGIRKRSGNKSRATPPYSAFENFPITTEELMPYDMLVLSDIAKESVIVSEMEKVLMGQNRSKLIVEYVEKAEGPSSQGDGRYFGVITAWGLVRYSSSRNITHDDRVKMSERANLK